MFFKTYHFKDYIQEQPLWKDAEYGVIVPYNLRKQKKKAPHLGRKEAILRLEQKY